MEMLELTFRDGTSEKEMDKVVDAIKELDNFFSQPDMIPLSARLKQTPKNKAWCEQQIANINADNRAAEIRIVKGHYVLYVEPPKNLIEKDDHR